MENVKVSVGKGRPYNPAADMFRDDIDINVPVYPLLGSFTKYSCVLVRAHNRGRNYDVVEHKDATGTCYKTGHGEWHCHMSAGPEFVGTLRQNVPPPAPRAVTQRFPRITYVLPAGWKMITPRLTQYLQPASGVPVQIFMQPVQGKSPEEALTCSNEAGSSKPAPFETRQYKGLRATCVIAGKKHTIAVFPAGDYLIWLDLGGYSER